MFFDLAFRKIAVALAVALSLALGTTATTALWAANRPLEERAAEALSRGWSGALYELRFAGPRALLAAASGARIIEAPRGSAVSVPVLLYHGESGGPSMTLATFVEHMRALHEAGWRTVTLEEFAQFMRGEADLPDKSFLLTFDDGRADTFYPADPVLKDLGYTAVMFVITGLSLPENADAAVNGFYLDKSELAYMNHSGRWELASHGDRDHGGYEVPQTDTPAGAPVFLASRHFLSNRFWMPGEGRVEGPAEYRARIEADLARAKALLEEDFGRPVTAYAYPFNDFGQESDNFSGAPETIAGVVRGLYRYAFYQTWAGNGDSFNYPNRDAYLVKRIEPAADWSGAKLIAVLDGGRAKPLPYAPRAFGADWQANWGTVAPGAALGLTAAASTTGAAAFLDGTEGWRDYAINATAEIELGTLSLIARHTGRDAPYLACAFSNDRIYLEVHRGAEQETLTFAPYTPPVQSAAYDVRMAISGAEASCSAYGVTVRAKASSVPTEGGVGVSVWDPGAGAARAELAKFSVTAL